MNLLQRVQAVVADTTKNVEAKTSAIATMVEADYTGLLGWVRRVPFVACAASAGLGGLLIGVAVWYLAHKACAG